MMVFITFKLPETSGISTLTLLNKRNAPPTFLCPFNRTLQGNFKKIHFHQPRLMLAVLHLKDMVENSPRFLLLRLIRSCSFNVSATIVKVFRSPGSKVRDLT